MSWKARQAQQARQGVPTYGSPKQYIYMISRMLPDDSAEDAAAVYERLGSTEARDAWLRGRWSAKHAERRAEHSRHADDESGPPRPNM